MAALNKQQGDRAEQQACDFLMSQGLTLIDKNYRGLRGEIDLIMQDQQHLVFIEVRSRNDRGFGNPIESITLQKQQKIIFTAIAYLQEKKLFNCVNSRFDVIGITDNKIEWIKDAFSDKFQNL